MQNKRIAVTGGAGFLGQNVVAKLKEHGCQDENICVIRSAQYDLTKHEDIRQMYADIKPDIVIHLAAIVGGIGANKDNPGTFYYKNLIMGAMLIEQARLCNVEKFVAIGTVCAYPKYAEVPFKEESLWDGYPEETNAPYGLAKKMMLVQSQAYRQEFGFNSIYLLPVNLYGPNDNFDLHTSHVIPALIKKCVEAKKANRPSIECWGTGKATREFLYVTDAAEAIVLATQKYNSSDPINIGTNSEISIYDLVYLIKKLTNYDGEVIWDTSKPDGQPRRKLCTDKATTNFQFTAKTTLLEGLQQTISWYERTQCT